MSLILLILGKSILERYGYTFADTNSQEANSSTGEDLFEY